MYSRVVFCVEHLSRRSSMYVWYVCGCSGNDRITIRVGKVFSKGGRSGHKIIRCYTVHFGPLINAYVLWRSWTLGHLQLCSIRSCWITLNRVALSVFLKIDLLIMYHYLNVLIFCCRFPFGIHGKESLLSSSDLRIFARDGMFFCCGG